MSEITDLDATILQEMHTQSIGYNAFRYHKLHGEWDRTGVMGWHSLMEAPFRVYEAFGLDEDSYRAHNGLLLGLVGQDRGSPAFVRRLVARLALIDGNAIAEMQNPDRGTADLFAVGSMPDLISAVYFSKPGIAGFRNIGNQLDQVMQDHLAERRQAMPEEYVVVYPKASRRVLTTCPWPKPAGQGELAL